MPDFLPTIAKASTTLVSIVIQGGLVMIPLLASSVIALTVVIERLYFWRRLRSQAVVSRILALVAEGDLPQAAQEASTSRHPVARVLGAGIASKHLLPGAAMQAAAQAELSQARRYLPVLDTVITLAPLLGLLGTITGMISAFGIVSEAGLGQPHAITGGIAEALIATATGLLIAIMTLIPYNYLRSKVEQLTDLLEEQATRLELLLGKRED
ncbi:MAG TPA: MotA/TolQ/ExbB proton channel family protein [Candidatus Tectomicrobia bacterium]|nr:MotA/TolQ/ExbB proton channel family protein [Candidatus Tectomicrobia bacterium]